MGFFALDVHRDFCEVAIAENGQVRRAGRVETSPATLELIAESLGVDDQVVLEATANALAIAQIIEPRVGRVVLASVRCWQRSATSGAFRPPGIWSVTSASTRRCARRAPSLTRRRDAPQGRWVGRC
jgi:hypothetical protein